MRCHNGYRIHCGCACKKCNYHTVLEGVDDANGAHYCQHCDDYVPTTGTCPAQTPEKVRARELEIWGPVPPWKE